jgi:hypothetical protein
MTHREAMAMFIIAVAGVAIIIMDHRLHVATILDALGGAPQDTQPEQQPLSDSDVSALFGTTNAAIPNAAARAPGALALAAAPHPGGNAWAGSIWNSAALQ